ncbi:MAG: hypothetical protein ACE5PT_10490 [Gemmatimonadales bacterium]
MRRLSVALVALVAVGAAAGASDTMAQAVPEGSQADRLDKSLRRWPTIGVDPFRYVFWPGWGLAFNTGAAAWNNSLNAADIGAIIFLADSTKNPDGLLPTDVLNIFGLVPKGEGFGGLASAEGGAYLGGPFGSSFSLGFTGQGRAYGAVLVNDGAVALFRDGTAADSSFDIGETTGALLATAEAGVHALTNVGPLASIDGPHFTLGVGARFIRPVAYARMEVDTTSRIEVTGSSIDARIGMEVLQTVDPADLGIDTSFAVATGGSGIAADIVLRLAWPTSGFALEAMFANLGSVSIENVQRQLLDFSVSTRILSDVGDSVDAAEFETQAIEAVEVTLPRIVRFSASGWANRILQLDAVATLPVSGDFDTPLLIELGSTWRLANGLPLRAGMLMGGRQGLGFTGSFGVESKNLLFRVTGASPGGLFRNAKGAGARFELGFFF